MPNSKFSKSDMLTAILVIGGVTLGVFVNKYWDSQKEDNQLENKVLLLANKQDSIKSEVIAQKILINRLDNIADKLSDRLDYLDKNTYDKNEINSQINKLESNYKDTMKRYGNVMYGDRQELMSNISSNRANVDFLMGYLQLKGKNDYASKPYITKLPDSN